jgi:two-component system, sensor histidine kinase ChiS
LLVIIIDNALQYYRLTTGKTKIELAEESGIWAVTQDVNGLVPKTLNKYLKIDTIPKKRPNWNAVSQTVRFVLSQKTVNPCLEEKKKLEHLLEDLIQLMI